MLLIARRKMATNADVIVVGSGVVGGMSADVLTQQGLRVLMLEARRNNKPQTETPMFQTNAATLLRGTSTPDRPFGFFDATVGGICTISGEPDVVKCNGGAQWEEASDWKATETNHWGCVSPRLGSNDFQPKKREGRSFDGSLGYNDVAPHDDLAEQVVGICGEKAGFENAPDNDCFPPPLRG